MKSYNNISKKVYSHKVNMAVLEAIPHGTESLLDLGCGKGENGREISKRVLLLMQ